MVLDRTVVAAGFVAESAGNPALAEPGCPCDEQVLVASDPVAAGEPGKDGAIDAAWRVQIDVFHACTLAQRGELEAGRETFSVALGGFAINQQSDALLERQGVEIRRSSLLLEGFGHSGQAKRDQPFMGGVCQHWSLPGSVEIALPADVAVAQGLVVGRLVEKGAIEAALEDRADRGDR